MKLANICKSKDNVDKIVLYLIIANYCNFIYLSFAMDTLSWLPYHSYLYHGCHTTVVIPWLLYHSNSVYS